jgi:hypothetical protein
MRENLRRPLLFLITVGTGSLIILVDATTEVIVAGTVLAGFLALVVTGTLDLAELKPSRLRAALRERREKKEPSDAPGTKKPGPAAEKPTRKPSSTGINLPGMLGTLAASVRETIAHARAPEGEKENKIEKLDAMLDQAVDGAAPEPSMTPVPPKAGGGSVDPLASLADLDLDSLEGFDLDGEVSGSGTILESDRISLLSGEDTDAISEILKAHQSDLDDLELTSGIDLSGKTGTTVLPIAADVPELPGGDGMPDMSALSEELSALDGLDFGEIEIEGEEEEDDEEEPVADEEVLEGIEEETKENFDMVSFASGGTVDDDLITALKSDAKKKKFVEDVSLVRELQGERYRAKDLAVELEDILGTMKAQR